MSTKVYFSDGTEFVAGGGAGECGGASVVAIAAGRDVPQNRGVLNAYKKAHQFVDLTWNALSTIPTNNSATGCSAGSHTGLLYSEALQFERYVGFGCSLRTFMTALHNPYSVMYTEDTKGTGARKKSAYGFNYLNTILNGAFYGTVCSGLTSYALGLPVIIQTYDFAWLAEAGLFEEVYDNTGLGVRLMDVIWIDGHVQLVTDIIRDERGTPVTIEVTESVQNYVVTSQRTPAFISNYLTTRQGKLYRYKELYKNLDYEQSSFVAVEGETAQSYIYNDDICTYLGDYVSIADWESMHINYVKGYYTSMELYKGDTLIQTITLPAEYNDTHSVDITSYLDGAGLYKARLTNGTDNSDYTYFEVVNTVVTVSKSGDNVTVTFSPSAKPVCIKVKNLNGHLLCTRFLTDDEKTAGSCTFNAASLRASQGRNAVSATAYARVIFDGTYSQVMSGTTGADIGSI